MVSPAASSVVMSAARRLHTVASSRPTRMLYASLNSSSRSFLWLVAMRKLCFRSPARSCTVKLVPM
jgi:hypothetical protein